MTALKSIKSSIYQRRYDEVAKLGKEELRKAVGDYDLLNCAIHHADMSGPKDQQFLDYLVDVCGFSSDRALNGALHCSYIKLAQKLRQLGCQPDSNQNFISSLETMKLVKSWNIRTPAFDKDAAGKICSRFDSSEAVSRLKLLYEDFEHPYPVSREVLSEIHDEEVFTFCLDHCQEGTDLMEAACRGHNFRAVDRLIERGHRVTVSNLYACCNAQDFAAVKRLQARLTDPPTTVELLPFIFSPNDSRCSNCYFAGYERKIEHYHQELGRDLIDWILANPEVKRSLGFGLDCMALFAKLAGPTDRGEPVITRKEVMDLVGQIDANGVDEYLDSVMEIIEKLSNSVDPTWVYDTIIDHLVFEAREHVEWGRISGKDLLETVSSFSAIPNLSAYLEKLRSVISVDSSSDEESGDGASSDAGASDDEEAASKETDEGASDDPSICENSCKLSATS
jgi:hypothetical protein